MNRKTLQKVIEELKKDKPDLSYIRGMLETMVDNLPPERPAYTPDVAPIPRDEEIGARLEAVKRLAKYE